jgi:hypothetical protein
MRGLATFVLYLTLYVYVTHTTGMPELKISRLSECNINVNYFVSGEPGSAVGKATVYGLDGPGIEFRCGRDFPHLSRQGVRCGRGVMLTAHLLLVPRSKIE